MSLSFAFVSSRPDLTRLIVQAHRELLTVPQKPGASLGWGVGSFHGDELVLRRRPNDQRDPVSLHAELADLRCHTLLTHVCDVAAGVLRTETTPPLRYGHLLFACHGPDPSLVELRGPVSSALPEFLLGQLQGDTFTELALSLFLSELPGTALERTRARSHRHRVEPLSPESLGRALRATLLSLDEFCGQAGVAPFSGDLWVTNGDVLMIAHRTGRLGLRVLRGREELETLPGAEDCRAYLDHARVMAAVAGDVELSVGWERLPDEMLVTVSRAATLETEKL